MRSRTIRSSLEDDTSKTDVEFPKSFSHSKLICFCKFSSVFTKFTWQLFEAETDRNRPRSDQPSIVSIAIGCPLVPTLVLQSRILSECLLRLVMSR